MAGRENDARNDSPRRARTSGSAGYRRSARYGFYAGCLFAGILALSGCSQVPGKLLVLEGNFFHSRGVYPRAVAAYMKALRYPQTAPYGEYGLGLVSLSLNEGNAALDRFAAAQKALRSLSGENHRDLRYRISYNRGIVYFEKEDFGEAARQFRNALEIDGTRVEAKRNLELSLLALSRAGTPVSSPADLVSGPGGNEILFDYIRQKEQNQWKSREWIEDVPASGPDY